MHNNFLKNTLNMLFYNFKTFILFELLYKTVIGVILLPIGVMIFNYMFDKSNYTYLTIENISTFFLQPQMIFIYIIFLLVLSILLLFDVSTIIVIFDESYHKNRIKLRDVLKIGFSKCRSVFKLNNILLGFIVLLFLPFLNLGISSNIFVSFKVPRFIFSYLTDHRIITLVIIYLLLVFIFSRWLFSFHYMIIENKNFKNASKYSNELIHKHRILDLCLLLLSRIIYVLGFIFILFVGLACIILVNRLLIYFGVLQHISMSIVWSFVTIVLISFTILSNGVSYAVLSSLFYRHKNICGERIIPVKHRMILRNKKNNYLFGYFIIVVSILAVLGSISFTYQIVKGKTNVNIEFLRETEITAHRGASVDYPENTMAAFIGAKDMGTDWIELDVQLTKDGEVVVFHDQKLLRIAGDNRSVCNLDYAELRKVSVGSGEYKDARVPLLSEVLAYAKDNNIRLNIELKPYTGVGELEENVIDLIKTYDLEDMCVVSSQSYVSLEKVKELSSDIKTVYVMGFESDDITDLEYADAYSISADFINEDLVHQAHLMGKEIFVWTINNEDDVLRMIKLNVDNITTDNIVMCRELIFQQRNSTFIQDYILELQK